MSLFNSMLGSLSPKFRSSFEDPHAREHELPLYHSPQSSPPVPPPIASTILWNTRNTSLSPPPRVPDDLLAIQRKARHLEQQLQELLDAQADGLMSGPGGDEPIPDDLASNGSTTPTVSSLRDSARGTENGDNPRERGKQNVGLNGARRGIFRRIQQLANVKAEEYYLLDDDLRELQATVQKTDTWNSKRARLQGRIRDIEGGNSSERAQSLKTEASKLEQEIRLKEEELWSLKARHRRVLSELANSENNVEAKLASYQTSLSILDREVASFLARPQNPNHVQLSSSPFLSLPPKRRTLEMAREYWQDESTRLTEKCEEVDMDRAALEEGAVLWNDVVKRVLSFEAKLQDSMQQLGDKPKADPSTLLAELDTTLRYLEDKLEVATSRSWNLLVCAIGAELEAFKQGKDILEQALGVDRKGKGKALPNLVDTDSSPVDNEEQGSLSAIRIGRSPPKRPAVTAKPRFFDSDEDPDPELLIETGFHD